MKEHTAKPKLSPLFCDRERRIWLALDLLEDREILFSVSPENIKVFK